MANAPAVLLGVLRSEQQRRNAPAVVALAAYAANQGSPKSLARSAISAIRKRLGVLRRMLNETAHFSKLDDETLVMARGDHKFREIRDQLVGYGISSDAVAFLASERRVLSIADLLKRRTKVLANLCAWLSIMIRARGLLSAYFEVICLYAVCVRECSQLVRRTWLVIGDLSTHQIALSGAVRVTGHKLISWQFDYLDFKRFPLMPDRAVVLNQCGVELARLNSPAASAGRIVWRPAMDVRPTDLGALESRPVGLLLNAFTDESSLLSILSSLQKCLTHKILIRPHPNSTLWETELPSGATCQARNESLEELVHQTGIIICGNTSAQLKALCLGAPIVQVQGLDPIPIDHHGYVRRGIVFGSQKVDDVQYADVISFYSSGDFVAGLQTLLGPPAARRLPSIQSMNVVDFLCLNDSNEKLCAA